MKFAATTAMLASLFTNASAFGIRHNAPKRAFTHATKALGANVLRLNNPQTELLDKVDVFIVRIGNL